MRVSTSVWKAGRKKFTHGPANTRKDRVSSARPNQRCQVPDAASNTRAARARRSQQQASMRVNCVLFKERTAENGIVRARDVLNEGLSRANTAQVARGLIVSVSEKPVGPGHARWGRSKRKRVCQRSGWETRIPRWLPRSNRGTRSGSSRRNPQTPCRSPARLHDDQAEKRRVRTGGQGGDRANGRPNRLTQRRRRGTSQAHAQAKLHRLRGQKTTHRQAKKASHAPLTTTRRLLVTALYMPAFQSRSTPVTREYATAGAPAMRQSQPREAHVSGAAKH